MEFPARMTFEWLWRNIPLIQTVEEFGELLDELERRGWSGTHAGTFGSNFLGMLEGGLQPHLKPGAKALRDRIAA